MYKELLIFPKSVEREIFYSNTARELVAEATDGFNIDPLVFSRMPDGGTLKGTYGDIENNEGWGVPPHVFFGGGRGLIRVTGIGLKGAKLIESEAATISTAISMKLNTPYSFKINEGICAIKRSRPFLYKINQLILSKKPSKINACKSENGRITLESVTPLIRRAITGGLISQCRFIDNQSLPMSMESEIGTDDMLGLRILEAQKVTFKKVKKDPQVYALMVSNLIFSIDLDLKGPWLAGILRSHGYGLIRKA